MGNVISLETLDQTGCHISIKFGMCLIYHPWDLNTPMLSGSIQDGMYIATIYHPIFSIDCTNNTSNNRPILLTAQSSFHQPLLIWHARLGHSNIADVNYLITRQLVTNVFIIPAPSSSPIIQQVCGPCMQGHSRAVISRLPQARASRKMELIHSDVRGPFPLSHGQGCYFIIFIDDYSRYVWLYVTRDESMTTISSTSQDFMHTYLTASDPIVQFRCDNGSGEYVNHMFQDILKRARITLETAAPYTQHQNSVAERKIQVI